MNTTLVDADTLLFRIACRDSSNKEMERAYKKIIGNIKAQTFAGDLKIAVKGKDNFRYKIYPDYKSHRPTLDPDMKTRLNYIHTHAIERGAVRCDGWEADDQIIAWQHELEYQAVIAGIDKDLRQVPGIFYNYNTNELFEVSPKEAQRNFELQLLIGDRGDGVPQLKKGFGAGKMSKLMDNGKTVIDIYRQFLPNPQWKKHLHVVGNLIYMRKFYSDTWSWKKHIRFYEEFK